MFPAINVLLLAALLTTLTACPGDDPAPASAPDGVADATATDNGAGDTQATDAAQADIAPDPGVDAGSDTGLSCPPETGARPSRRSEHAGIYDPVADRVIIFGGSFAVPVNCGFPAATFEDETWAYDTTCDRWTQLQSTTGPEGRVRHMATYDALRHRMIVFGGRARAGSSGPYELFNDLWALDLTTDSWSQLSPAGASPSARVNGAFVYDPVADRLLLFGGNNSASGAFYQSLNDVWQFDFGSNAWTQLTVPGPAPAPRLFTAAFWDAQRERMVVYGGADETAFNQNVQYFDDLWALSFDGGTASWTELDAQSPFAPPGRFWGALVHDTVNDRYISFAGHDNGTGGDLIGNRNDMWVFLPEAGEWTAVTEGDTYNKPALGFCLFPPDYTIVQFDLPERRNSHVFVAGPDGAFTMGGKTDCGVSDDLWKLSFSDLAWEERTFATVGEVCARNSGSYDNCTGMCL